MASRKKTTKKKSPAKPAGSPSRGGSAKVKKKADAKKPAAAASKSADKPPKAKPAAASQGRAVKSGQRPSPGKAAAARPASPAPASVAAKNESKRPPAPSAAAAAKAKTASESGSLPAPVAVASRASASGRAARSSADEDNRDDNGVVLSPEQLRKVKTGLKKKDLEYFFNLLMEKRSEILGDVASLESDARKEGVGVSYEHMADVGSDQYEQEFTLGLVESEAKLLREINDAILRVRDGIYGVCLKSGTPIGRPRLEAKPWAKYCIEVARDMERRGQV